MVLTNFNGAGVGFGFGAGCGFGVGWGFGADGTAFGSQYHSSGVTCQGIDFGKKEHDDAVQKSNQDIRASLWLFITPFPHHFRV